MKLSVIVPVYKVEETLERCVKSVLSQGFHDFELLLIDDGSPDGCPRLVDEISQAASRKMTSCVAKDDLLDAETSPFASQVVAFHKPNGGLSDARNYGVERARGEYITFIDSDDEIEVGTFEALAEAISRHADADIIEYPVTERPGRPDEHRFEPGDHVYADALDWLSDKGLEHCWAWNKVYKRELFSTVRFPVGKTYEDVWMTERLLLLHPKIVTISRGRYLYHWNGRGIVASSKRDGLTTLLEAQVHLVKALGLDTRERRWHRLYLNMLTNQLHTYGASKKLLLWPQRLSVRRYNGRNDAVKAMLLNLLGLRLMCRLFSFLHRKGAC